MDKTQTSKNMEKNIKVTSITDRGRYHWIPKELVEWWIQKADDENNNREKREWYYAKEHRQNVENGRE